MAYCILRTKKYSSLAAARGSERHGLERQRIQTRTHAEMEKYNRYVFCGQYSQCDSLTDAYNLAIKNVKRKIRSNAVKIIEVVMTFSPEVTRTLPLKDWAIESLDWAKDYFGESNLVSYRIDMDESTPHIHAYIVPISKGRDDGDRLCARDFLGGRGLLSKMQDSYADAMAQFGLERGREGSRARHMDSRSWWEMHQLDKAIYGVEDYSVADEVLRW